MVRDQGNDEWFPGVRGEGGMDRGAPRFRAEKLVILSDTAMVGT